MTEVYVLWHDRDRDDPETDTEFLLGIFSTREAAEDAARELATQPGFRRFPDDFIVDPWTLDDWGWREGFATMLGDGTWVQDPGPES